MEPQTSNEEGGKNAQVITKTTPVSAFQITLFQISYMSLQVLLEFERYFQIFWGIVTFTFLYYKKYQLIYPDGYFELEQIGVVLLVAL